ncbi:hypothetical protein PoMZ_02941 [Pyricularia oryzae]|uniref:Uncharacterized protein n=1 Tax=Pyricularia oryzae TaxID=318829 RepID=A0A4P7N8K1_PYROR|nr:hypothetical protein PoMZ_02941 [Pyricularia oryzae]
MQRVLSHERDAHKGQQTETERHVPDTGEALHKGVNDTILPPVRQPLELAKVVPDAPNLLCRTRQVTKALPQTPAQLVLVDGRCDGDAEGRADGAEGVGGRRHHRLLRVVDRGHASHHGDGQHGPVAHADQEETGHGRPAVRVPPQRADHREPDGLDQQHAYAQPEPPTTDDMAVPIGVPISRSPASAVV